MERIILIGVVIVTVTVMGLAVMLLVTGEPGDMWFNNTRTVMLLPSCLNY